MKADQIEQWDVFEVVLEADVTGNPFVDVTLTARFTHRNRTVEVDGFFDGDNTFRVRFSPDTVGEWSYVTASNLAALDGRQGTFRCAEAATGNHGPVSVANGTHFAYADGSTYLPVGTTCYVWNHQGDEMEAQTLETLRDAPFNKMRMCVFPKHYLFNANEPEYYPFVGTPLEAWDFTRFDPAFFRHLERLIEGLLDIGCEAELILFHPYDRWGFSRMNAETDDRYLRYLVARVAAYRNVWWSFANEFDLMSEKQMSDWDRFFRIVQECDPYDHPRSIHNCRGFYDHAKRWVTHASIQHHELARVGEWIDSYRKPVVVDECGYEGDIHRDWGNLTAEELVNRFWIGFCQGGYVGHGETFVHPEDLLWWSKGGVLSGESPKRIAFLRMILEEAPGGGLDRVPLSREKYCVGKSGEYYLCYFADRRPAYREFELPEGKRYRIEVIDTWNMTIDAVAGLHSGKVSVDLPARPYIAVRMTASE